MEKELLLSIIIPVYNTEKTLERCIHSLTQQFTSQVLPLIEVLCVDDGSSDRSWNILQEFNKQYPTIIKIFTKENGGPSSARNYALKEAKGAYLAFVDSDDYVTKQYLDSIITTLQQQPDIDILEIGVNSNNGGEKLPLIINHPQLSFKENFVYQCKYFLFARVINHETFQGISFDESIHLCEDAVFLTYCYSKASVFSRVDKYIYHYVANLTSLTQIKSNKQLKDLDYIIQFSKEKLQMEACDNLLYLGLLANMLYFRRGLKTILTKQVRTTKKDVEELKLFYRYKSRYEKYGRKLTVKSKILGGLKFPTVANFFTLVRYG